ncbi:MAG: hypothetical protein DCF31_15080 [Alphaproteobacteria bacterium]|nr:MAG: hypothetical protein DCF31_15080 [Alphaproteobacteria bacterium]
MTDDNGALLATMALLERRLSRSVAARLEAESLLERRSRELDRSNRDLQRREQDLVAQLDTGNRNLLQAQQLAGIATFFRMKGERFRVSAAMADILGIPVDPPPSGADFARALHPLDRDRIVGGQRVFFASSLPGEEYRAEGRIVRPDGAVRWLRWMMKRDLASEGAAAPVAGTVQDITEQRGAQRRTRALQLIGERNLRRLRQTEALLAQRVAELERAAAELAASHARTDAAHSAKARFLSMMSHKVRTPMNGVLGMMTAMTQTDLDPQQARQLALARAAGDELRVLVDEIIDIADGGPALERRAGAVADGSAGPLLVAGRRPRILVAEDIETNQIVLTSMLDSLGCDHVVVGDGALAVTAAAGGGIDAILMDIQMPVMDGTEATRQIRALPGGLGAVPIIGITAQALQAERQALRAAGMNQCLAKPISVPMLDAALRAVLRAVPIIDARLFQAAMAAMPQGRRLLLIEQVGRDLRLLADEFAGGVARGDAEAVRRARHSLVGVAGNFGLVGLSEVLAATRDLVLPARADADALQAAVAAAVAEAQALLAAPRNRRATDQ